MNACGCRTFLCRLDTALHALGFTLRPVCDRHDHWMLQ